MDRLKQRSKDRKGFTLAELLIVVAIIAVLVAISLAIFSQQLAKARRATNEANARSAYAAAMARYLSNGTLYGTYSISDGHYTSSKTETGLKLDAVDYGSRDTGVIMNFTVIITPGTDEEDDDATAIVYPQDNSSNATYNKAGQNTGYYREGTGSTGNGTSAGSSGTKGTTPGGFNNG